MAGGNGRCMWLGMDLGCGWELVYRRNGTFCQTSITSLLVWTPEGTGSEKKERSALSLSPAVITAGFLLFSTIVFVPLFLIVVAVPGNTLA